MNEIIINFWRVESNFYNSRNNFYFQGNSSKMSFGELLFCKEACNENGTLEDSFDTSVVLLS